MSPRDPQDLNPTPEPRDYRRRGLVIFWCSVAILLGVYSSLLFWPGEDWVVSIEKKWTRYFNGLLLHDATWDWTLLVLGSEFWLLVLVGGALVSAVEDAWRRRLSDYGRILGYLAFAVVASLAIAMTADEISATIERPRPRKAMAGLADVADFYDARLDIPVETGVPDENIAGLACLGVLLLLRNRRTGGLLIAGTIAHGGALLVIGDRWILDIVAAVFFGSAGAGAFLWLSPRAIGWIEQKSEQRFLEGFWHSLVPGGGERKELKRIRLDFALRGGSLPRKRRKVRDEAFWQELAVREVQPLFNLRGESCTLLRDPPGDAGAGRGGSRSVRFLQVSDNEVVVIKAAWGSVRPWQRDDRVNHYGLSARNSVALARLGFPVPRLYWAKEGYLRGGLFRYVLTAEEFLEGRRFDPANADDLGGALAIIARMHGHDRGEWGRLTEPARGDARAYLWMKLKPAVRSEMTRLKRGGGDSEWPPGLEAAVWNEFRRVGIRLLYEESPPFRLSHGDARPSNFIVTGRGVFMMDFVTVGYALVAREILAVAHRFSNGDDAVRRLVWSRYFELAGMERWHEFKRQAGLCLGLFALHELAHDRILPVDWRGDPSAVLPWIRQVLNMEEAAWGETPGETKWAEVDRLLCGGHQG